MRDRKRVLRLVKLRKKLEDQRRGTVIRAAQAEREAVAAESVAHEELVRAGDALTSVGAVPAPELVMRSGAVSWARQELADASVVVAEKGEARREAQGELATAQRERKAVERVAERLDEARARKIAKAEQQQSDEAGARIREASKKGRRT